ncbi:hypothetical protein [Microlunatus speluncae]|uniref:hypothetical protein n=1 Tax=Microlunatus speluncae TaxID=2594267 RepID=UPI00126622BB|nr:hypothetical protein [Microlunatus speluncae]
MDEAGYEVRHGLKVRDALSLVVSILAVVLGLRLFDHDPVPALIVVAFFGCCALWLIVTVVGQWGRTALRVDQDGVTFGRLLLHGKGGKAATVPWEQIGAIVVFQQRYRGIVRQRYVGLKGRGGRPVVMPIPWGHGPIGAWFIGAVPPEIVAASRPVTGWNLDHNRLARALESHAPARVRLVSID